HYPAPTTIYTLSLHDALPICEVHTHTRSFAVALRGALREDPDVIMVGEMRDLETISLAITASETGHLVLGTLHTGTAARTLDRVDRKSTRLNSSHRTISYAVF